MEDLIGKNLGTNKIFTSNNLGAGVGGGGGGGGVEVGVGVLTIRF